MSIINILSLLTYFNVQQEAFGVLFDLLSFLDFAHFNHNIKDVVSGVSPKVFDTMPLLLDIYIYIYRYI